MTFGLLADFGSAACSAASGASSRAVRIAEMCFMAVRFLGAVPPATAACPASWRRRTALAPDATQVAYRARVANIVSASVALRS